MAEKKYSEIAVYPILRLTPQTQPTMVGPRVNTMCEEPPALHNPNVSISEKYRVFSIISNEVPMWVFVWMYWIHVNMCGAYMSLAFSKKPLLISFTEWVNSHTDLGIISFNVSLLTFD